MKPIIATGKARIISATKMRISDTHYLWHLICEGGRGKVKLLAKYPIGKEYTERVKKLVQQEYAVFEADVVDGEFFVTNIRPDTVLGKLWVEVYARGKIINIYPFGNGKKIVLSNDWGDHAFIDNSGTGNIGDEVSIKGTIANGLNWLQLLVQRFFKIGRKRWQEVEKVDSILRI